MRHNTLAIFGVLVFGTAVVFASVANAQVYTAPPNSAPAPTVTCVNIAYSLGYGSTDYYTKGSVSQLQQFLVGQGYFNAVYLGTGRFGPITGRAVVQYQAAHGVSPVGVVGPITRATIYNQTCGGIIVPPTNQAPGISTPNPSAGPVGTQVTIPGYNLTSDNSVLIDGMVAVHSVAAKPTGIVCIAYPCQGSQSITITIPEYVAPYCGPGMHCAMMVRALTPGAYQLSVQNQNGTSNPQTFVVTEGSSNMQTLY